MEGISVKVYPFFFHSSSNLSRSFTVSEIVWKNEGNRLGIELKNKPCKPYLFQCIEILFTHPRNLLDSFEINVILVEFKLGYWRRRYKPTLKFWMFFLDDIQNTLVRKAIRRSKDDAFPVLRVGLAIQSSDMGLSGISKVNIDGTREILASREEKIIYHESSRKGGKVRLWKWNKFGWEWAVEEGWGDYWMRHKRLITFQGRTNGGLTYLWWHQRLDELPPTPTRQVLQISLQLGKYHCLVEQVPWSLDSNLFRGNHNKTSELKFTSSKKKDTRSARYVVPFTVGSPVTAIIELVTTNFLTPAFSAWRKTFKEPSMAV